MDSNKYNIIQKLKVLSPDLFPTTWSFVVFILYMALFINQGILVTSTKNSDKSYDYNVTTVVLLTECLKLIISTILYVKGNGLVKIKSEVLQNTKVLCLYFVPAFLYCLYNNLQFVNLAEYDPTTYYLLLQFRVVVTGVVFQVVFKKVLSGKQWFSLVLLTVGCVIKEVHFVSAQATTGEADQPASFFSFLNMHLILIFVQVFCSCFAGVYNEYLLKDVGASTPIMLQNVFMYVDSIVCNVVLLICRGKLLDAFKPDALASIYKVKVICIIFNMAGIGIVTSFFLKNLNSILKTFASAMEIMFTAVLCWIIFDIPVDAYTIIAIGIVSMAIFVYCQNPVVNLGKLNEGLVSSKSDSNIEAAGSTGNTFNT